MKNTEAVTGHSPRRRLLGKLFFVPALVTALSTLGMAQIDGTRDNCRGRHNWSKAKLWALGSANTEEPKFFPPSLPIRLEYCSGCGLVRVSDEALKLFGPS
jgi:hypothetical protein